MTLPQKVIGFLDVAGDWDRSLAFVMVGSASVYLLFYRRIARRAHPLCDTLFIYGCGRCDLAGSDPAAMFHSLRMLSEEIPDEVSIHPGHHYALQPSTNMAEQRRANPFLHLDAEAAFIAFRAEHNRHRLPPYRPIPRGMPAW